MKPTLFCLLVLVASGLSGQVPPPSSSSTQLKPGAMSAAKAINGFGLDLHRSLAKETPDSNLLTSPYSIEYALALAARGAEGDTLAEMRRVLHAPGSEVTLLAGLAGLREELSLAVELSAQRVRRTSRHYGGPSTPIKLEIANNLFVQKGYPLRRDYLDYVSRDHSPLEFVDFHSSPEDSRKTINAWIDRKTVGLIPDLIPPVVSAKTLVSSSLMPSTSRLPGRRSFRRPGRTSFTWPMAL